MAIILLADDREASRELLETVLRLEGYELITAGDGQEAIECAENQVADLAILDLHMPRLDGFATLAALKARPEWAKIPVLAITASVMESDRQQALQAGFSAFMAKPINLADLRRTVRELLQQ